jgi:L-ascorbate metabolism protein UlaG (beta-lactamase superfamily)
VATYRLNRDVSCEVIYRDDSCFGSPIGERPDLTVRQCFAPLLNAVAESGFGALHQAEAPLRQCIESPAFGAIATDVSARGWTLLPEFLYPNSDHAFLEKLRFVRKAAGEWCEIDIARNDWPVVHELLANLATAEPAPLALDGDLGDLLHTFAKRKIVTTDPKATPSALPKTDLFFLGHNTVLVCSETTAVLIDPLFFPHDSDLPAGYAPVQACDLGQLDAVLITHSHPDHFDPASLMRLPPHVRMIVPVVERESVLSLDMAYRLQELGFTRIKAVRWGSHIVIGDISVDVLPFFGEQPTTGAVLHPEVRNIGNTYRVTTPRLSAMFLADSGRDVQGSVFTLAEEVRRTYGTVDYVFSGFRGWVTYPVQLLLSSVARYFVFVPPMLWGTRQVLMLTAQDAFDVAETLGARYLVPYADGGAPWHWQIGLGAAPAGKQVMDGFDADPVSMINVALTRTMLPDNSRLQSSVKPLLVRPNEGIRDRPDGVTIVRLRDNRWPYSKLAPSTLPYVDE